MSEQEEVNAVLKRFTPRARQSLSLAQKDAEKSNHDCISVEHLLRGICLLKEGIAVEVLRAMKVDFQDLMSELAKKLPQSGSVNTMMTFQRGGATAEVTPLFRLHDRFNHLPIPQSFCR